MAKQMLIDATHPEETRMAIMEDGKLLEYECEYQSKRALKGNIYLGKIVRVEPSLQAAFVEYGGNRHGFLPFSEIHPDYFRIPVDDRQKLMEEEWEKASEEGDEDNHVGNEEDRENASVSDDEALDEKQNMKPKALHRMYKIQEVIHKGQVVLIQVVKEERGGKGASLTAYLSLPGRYGVLMPNAIRPVGISRKITNMKDRQRLRSIIQEFNLPKSMGVIIRTAGLERTKKEIKRDLTYLLKLWNSIREETLSSVAPKLIYEEGDLVKRSLRDTYSHDVDEVFVEGKEAYRQAKDLIKKLVPSHAKRVKNVTGQQPSVFQKYNIHAQVGSMFDPVVPLPSGGYLVMNITEALVAIDVNSGRSTKERHIEGTAVKTNLEAAEEVARQLRLRDMAGIVVIDFIDMADNKHIAAVERRFREAVRQDRARIQVGHISMFGLLEMSRQRIRPSIAETSSQKCKHCDGMGIVRSVESSALQALRAVEGMTINRLEEKTKTEVVLYLPHQVAYYVMNNKRHDLLSLEERHNIQLQVREDNDLKSYHYRIMHISDSLKEEAAANDMLKRKMESVENGMNLPRFNEVSSKHKRQTKEMGDKNRRRSEKTNTRNVEDNRRHRRRKNKNMVTETKISDHDKKNDVVKSDRGDPFVVHDIEEGIVGTSQIVERDQLDDSLRSQKDQDLGSREKPRQSRHPARRKTRNSKEDNRKKNSIDDEKETISDKTEVQSENTGSLDKMDNHKAKVRRDRRKTDKKTHKNEEMVTEESRTPQARSAKEGSENKLNTSKTLQKGTNIEDENGESEKSGPNRSTNQQTSRRGWLQRLLEV